MLVVNLGLQFQESLGGVFHERFASLDAVIREAVFVIAVDKRTVCPCIVVGRTPQIDCVRARCASLEVDEAHHFHEKHGKNMSCLKLVLTILVLGLAPPAFGNYFLTFDSIEFVQAFV